MDNILKRLNLFMILLGVLAPAGYLMGVNFYQGQLHTYGIFADSLPISIQESYVDAYYATGYIILALAVIIANFLKLLFTLKGTLISALIIILISTFFYYMTKPKEPSNKAPNKLKNKIKKILHYIHWDNNRFTRSFGVTGFLSYLLLVLLYFIPTLAVFWFAIPYAAFAQGENLAKKNRDLYLKNDCTIEKDQFFNNCHTLRTSDGDIIVQGILVAQSGDIIAFFTKDGSFVSKIPEGAILNKSLTK